MSPFGLETGPWNRRGMPHDTKFSPGIDIIVTASLSLSSCPFQATGEISPAGGKTERYNTDASVLLLRIEVFACD